MHTNNEANLSDYNVKTSSMSIVDFGKKVMHDCGELTAADFFKVSTQYLSPDVATKIGPYRAERKTESPTVAKASGPRM